MYEMEFESGNTITSSWKMKKWTLTEITDLWDFSLLQMLIEFVYF